MIDLIKRSIIGKSSRIKEVVDLIQLYASYPTPVLISGETGTGKELVARGLHYAGKHADAPFLAVNCSTFSDELFASEVFGHKKGSFTDARKDHKGILAEAEGGTVFLDEIDSLSLKSQASLLRLLQEGEYRPVGATANCKAHVRIVAASNRYLPDLIKQGRFREDLYYRLLILTIDVPPLRQRIEDVSELIPYFFSKFERQYGLGPKMLAPDIVKQFKTYHWPGNIRELENMLHRIYLTCPDAKVTSLSDSLLPDKQGFCPIELTSDKTQVKTSSERTVSALENGQSDKVVVVLDELNFAEAKRKAIEQFEQDFVTELMKQTNGNITKAASICGKERSAFGKLVKKYNVKNEDVLV